MKAKRGIKRRSARPRRKGRTAPDRYEALAEFRYALRKFVAFSEGAARKAGLTPQQHQTLVAVRGLPRGEMPTIGYIAERLMLRHHSAVELVNRLARMGLVKRAQDEADRRRVLVKLTAKGERRLERLSKAHVDELRGIRPVLVTLLKRFGRR